MNVRRLILILAPLSISALLRAGAGFNDYEEVNFKRGQPALLILWSMRCPCARKYGRQLNKIHSDYGAKGLQMAGIDPFPEESAEEIKVFSKQWKIEFPVLKDEGGKLAKKFKLGATPEAFLFDKDGRLAYSGAIDDALYFMKKAKSHYLMDALEDVFNGRKPAVAFREPWGCAYFKGG